MRDGYDISQICLNGHVINDSTREFPEHNKDFCDKCGEKTITTCQKCKSDIQGCYHVKGVVRSYKTPASHYCKNCGNPFPWTEAKINSALELVKELELSEENQEIINENINDIITETPKTDLAVIRFKKVMSSIGKNASEMFKNILTNILSEAIKKQIWP